MSKDLVSRIIPEWAALTLLQEFQNDRTDHSRVEKYNFCRRILWPVMNTVKASKGMRLFLDKLMIRAPWFYGSSPDPVPILAWCVFHWCF